MMQFIKLAVIIPVYNDWLGLDGLLDDLDQCLSNLKLLHEAVVFVVDDGSVLYKPTRIAPSRFINRVEVLRLGCNLGHQRAIAIGLSEAVCRSEYDVFLVMDSDGEDTPMDASNLLASWFLARHSVFVAKRSQRHEGFIFQASYRFYRLLFYLLSGRSLDFGNFAVFSAESALRLVHMPELWNHFAASVLRSKLPLVRIPTNKGLRSHGYSKMNFVGLVNHGLSAASVWIDVVFARLLVISSTSAVAIVAAALYVLYQKVFTSYAIPGWASSMVSFSLLGLLQLFALVFVLIFLVLSSRSRFQRPTLHQALEYIHSRTVIHPE